MPFIPFSSSYKLSSLNSSLDQDGSNSNNNNRSDNNININDNTNNNLNGSSCAIPIPLNNSNTNILSANSTGGNNNSANSNHSSNNNSTNNSPLLQQGSSSLRKKSSIGNTFFGLVNSIRQPNIGQSLSSSSSSKRQSINNRRNSQSSSSNINSQSHSRSRSRSTSKQPSNSNPNSNPNSGINPTSNSDDLERARVEVESANPFQYELTPELVGENRFNDYNHSNTLGRSIRENSSAPQLTRILSNGEERPTEGSGIISNGNVLIALPHIHDPNESPRSQHTNNSDNSNNSNNLNSISITNGDNNAHNTFNPAAYNYNMSNSLTIPNFRVYANGGIVGDNNNNIIQEPTNIDTRTRGNTLREEPILYEAVAMDSGNNPTIGTAINNPITIDDSRDDIIITDVREDTPDTTSPNNNNIHNNNQNTTANIHNTLPTIINATTTNNNETNTTGTNNINNNNNINTPKNNCDANGYYSIRLTPSIDHSSTRPYMFFGPIIRKLKPGKSIFIGRYTEKNKHAATAAAGSSEPIVFKSKVVSRKHAELTVDDKGRWYIQDIKSSSGTFLNHVRLSLPNTESPKIFLNDSDILQLGVDYRGGSEDMYRCVKVKIELNYSWKKRAAKFSKEAHEKLKNLTNMNKIEELTPCVICLDDIKPCQAVFVSSCSHSWHYKCIRPLLVKTYPQFLCPNCKAVCDLEADLEDGEDEDGEEDYFDEDEGEVEREGEGGNDNHNINATTNIINEDRFQENIETSGNRSVGLRMEIDRNYDVI